MHMKQCPHCNAELPQEANFCLYCMTKLTDETEVAVARRPWWRFLLLAVIPVIVIAIAVLLFFTLSDKTGQTLPSPTPSSATSRQPTALSPTATKGLQFDSWPHLLEMSYRQIYDSYGLVDCDYSELGCNVYSLPGYTDPGFVFIYFSRKNSKGTDEYYNSLPEAVWVESSLLFKDMRSPTLGQLKEYLGDCTIADGTLVCYKDGFEYYATLGSTDDNAAAPDVRIRTDADHSDSALPSALSTVDVNFLDISIYDASVFHTLNRKDVDDLPIDSTNGYYCSTYDGRQLIIAYRVGASMIQAVYVDYLNSLYKQRYSVNGVDGTTTYDQLTQKWGYPDYYDPGEAEDLYSYAFYSQEDVAGPAHTYVAVLASDFNGSGYVVGLYILRNEFMTTTAVFPFPDGVSITFPVN